MSSSGGPRAAGSGLATEGKFRQRVEDHYKLMASSKKRLGLASKLQLVSAVGATGVVGMLGAAGGGDGDATTWMVLAGLLALFSGLVSRSASATAAPALSAQQVEKCAASFARWCSIVLALLGIAMVLTAASGGGSVGLPPQPARTVGGLVLAIDSVGCALGMRATAALRAAFEMQKAKAKAK